MPLPGLLPPLAHRAGPGGLPGPQLPTFTASVLVIAFPGGAGTASLERQARRSSSRSPLPVVVIEAGHSFAALQWVQQAKPPKTRRQNDLLPELQDMQYTDLRSHSSEARYP